MIDRLRMRLAGLAASGTTITYGQLARDLGLTGAGTIAQLTAALEALMEEDASQGLPFRASLCEARLSGGMPAPGFFAKVAALGREIGDPQQFVATERAALKGLAKASML